MLTLTCREEASASSLGQEQRVSLEKHLLAVGNGLAPGLEQPGIQQGGSQGASDQPWHKSLQMLCLLLEKQSDTATSQWAVS